MNGFLYGVVLQWKLDLRSRTMLISCYAVPLLFFAVMGGIFTSVMPESKETLIQSMTVFAVTMGGSPIKAPIVTAHTVMDWISVSLLSGMTDVKIPPITAKNRSGTP